jgi:hypothetical protein
MKVLQHLYYNGKKQHTNNGLVYIAFDNGFYEAIDQYHPQKVANKWAYIGIIGVRYNNDFCSQQ